MKPAILVVEDNPSILFNIQMILELNGYELITATNGQKALEILSHRKKPPDLLISDIIMPEMDGYSLFKAVSDCPQWCHIPFVKMLGASDYITKPFDEKDLLACIAGKLRRSQRIQNVIRQIEEKLQKYEQLVLNQTIITAEKEAISVFIMVWDENQGPILRTAFPTIPETPFPIDYLGKQLFQATTAVLDQNQDYGHEGLLLTLDAIKQQGYVFLDLIPDPEGHGSKRRFMFGTVAPKINYLESLRIQEILEDLATRIKRNEGWEMRDYWNRVTKVLAVF
jgi:CheY-like chemotaxis protein